MARCFYPRNLVLKTGYLACVFVLSVVPNQFVYGLRFESSWADKCRLQHTPEVGVVSVFVFGSRVGLFTQVYDLGGNCEGFDMFTDEPWS